MKASGADWVILIENEWHADLPGRCWSLPYLYLLGIKLAQKLFVEISQRYKSLVKLKLIGLLEQM